MPIIKRIPRGVRISAANEIIKSLASMGNDFKFEVVELMTSDKNIHYVNTT